MKLRFKTITMRMWAAFTATVLLLAVSLHLVQVFIFREIETQDRIDDLIFTHEMLLELEFHEFATLTEYSALQGILHFLYYDGIIYRVSVYPLSLCDIQCDGRYLFASFAEPGIRSEIITQHWDGTDYIIAITETDNGAFLFSYIPDVHDSAFTYFLFVASGVFILIGLATAQLTTIYISKPFAKLDKFIKKIAAKEWSEPIVIDSHDEIGRFAESINKMQEDLKRADEQEKNFFQNMSHDLKTPTMVIMSHADAIVDGVHVDSLEKTAQIIRDESLRLSERINQLLYYSTLDYVLEHNKASVIELDKVVNKVIDKFEIIGDHLDFDLDIEKVKIKGDYEKFTIAIENIWDNAIRHAKARISVSLKSYGDFARLEFFNDGDTINPKDIDKVFDSLYKGEKGNYGLGLPISKKIIEFFGGKIWVENKENGVSFILEGPIVD